MDTNKDGNTKPCTSIDTHLTLSSVENTELVNRAQINPIHSADSTSTSSTHNSRGDIYITPQSLIMSELHEPAVANCFACDKQYEVPSPNINDDMRESTQQFQPLESVNNTAQVTTAGSEDGNDAPSPKFCSSDYGANSEIQRSEDIKVICQTTSDKESYDDISRSKTVQDQDLKTNVADEPQLELPAVTTLRVSRSQGFNEGILGPIVNTRQAKSVSKPNDVLQPPHHDQDSAFSMTRAPVGESTRPVSLHLLRPSRKTAEVPPANLVSRKSYSQRFRNQDYEYSGQNGYSGNRDRGRDDDGRSVRLQAQLARAQSELTIERETNAKMRKTVETEVQALTDAAINSLLVDLYHKQVSVEKSKLALRHTQIDLEMREAQSKQSEIFLALGQKFLSAEAERGSDTFSQLQIDNARKQGWHEGIASHQHAQAELEAQAIAANIREEKIALLEKNWKTQARERMEAELREALWEEITERIADTEYNRGFECGKEFAQTEIANGSREEGYLEGYRAARVAQDALISVRNGTLPLNSPALDFLFNPEHPDNIFNRGIQIGRHEGAKKYQNTSPLPKLTMAAELHGPVSMHNGHVVLANSNTGRNTSTTSVSSNANDAVCDSGPDVGTPVKQPNVGSCEGRLTPPEDDRFLPPKRTNLHKGARISLSGSTKGENIFPSARTKLIDATGEYAHSNVEVERTPDLIDFDS